MASNAVGPLVHTAEIQPPVSQTDSDPSNNVSSDTNAVDLFVGRFYDGFEDRQQGPVVKRVGPSYTGASVALDFGLLAGLGDVGLSVPIPVLYLPLSSKRGEIVVHAGSGAHGLPLRLAIKTEAGVWQVGTWQDAASGEKALSIALGAPADRVAAISVLIENAQVDVLHELIETR